MSATRVLTLRLAAVPDAIAAPAMRALNHGASAGATQAAMQARLQLAAPPSPGNVSGRQLQRRQGNTCCLGALLSPGPEQPRCTTLFCVPPVSLMVPPGTGHAALRWSHQFFRSVRRPGTRPCSRFNQCAAMHHTNYTDQHTPARVAWPMSASSSSSDSSDWASDASDAAPARAAHPAPAASAKRTQFYRPTGANAIALGATVPAKLLSRMAGRKRRRQRSRPTSGRGCGRRRGLDAAGEPRFEDKHPSWQAAVRARHQARKAVRADLKMYDAEQLAHLAHQ